jgi:hypothetical protein
MVKRLHKILVTAFLILFLGLAASLTLPMVGSVPKAALDRAHLNQAGGSKKPAATKGLEGTVGLLLGLRKEPFLLFLLGMLLLCAAAGLERNRLSWMKSKFAERDFGAWQPVLRKQVTHIIHHHRGHNGKYQTTQNH